jgi:hypothetical protein
MSTNAIPKNPLEQRQLTVITRRLDQVEPVVDAIHRATAHLPAADHYHIQQRLHEPGNRGQRSVWDVSHHEQQHDRFNLRC